MARMVGMSRPIKQEWLNKTVDLLLEGKDPSQIKEELNEYLSFEIKSPTNKRKTREILMAIWIYTPYELAPLKQQAIEVYKNYKRDLLAVHWSMILATYPIFADVCSLIGKLSNIQDTFTTAWLRERVYEEWGERATLLHATDKLLQTLKYIGAIKTVKTGVFQIKKHNVNLEETAKLLVLALVSLKEKAYYDITEIPATPCLFPFNFDVSRKLLHNTEMFKLGNFGGRVVLTVD